MQQNSSVQAARKSHKLESLPGELKSVADELIAKKFPEPEILEAKKKSTRDVYDEYGGSNVYRFLHTPNINLSAFNGDPTEPVQLASDDDLELDPQTESILERIDHLPEGIAVQIDVEFYPVGTFTNRKMADTYRWQQEIRSQTLRVQSRGGDAVSARYRIECQLEMLNKMYGGKFIPRIKNYEVSHDDWDRRMYGYR